MVESIKNFFFKFISGHFGLAITFWLYGVLVALTLDFLTSHVTTLWQVIFLAVITLTHFGLIVIAVWNASKLYLGKSHWKWLARIVVFLNVFKWLWYLPLLIAISSNALGFPIHSNEYWKLNTKGFVCEPAEYLGTPKMLAAKYKCKSSLSLDNQLIMTRCWQGSEVRDFLFTKNEQDCQKYLTKLKFYLREHKK